MRFNPLTNTVALIACAVSLAGEVGVDAERGLRFVTIEPPTRRTFVSGSS